MNFLECYRRHQLRKRLSIGASKEVLDEILSGGTDEDHRNLKAGHIEFVLAAVGGGTPDVVNERMGKVADIASEHHGMVDSLISSLVVVTFGTFDWADQEAGQEAGNRFTLIVALRQALEDDIKIVHGARSGWSGFLGSADTQMQFSFIVPDFMDALGSLASLAPGGIREV